MQKYNINLTIYHIKMYGGNNFALSENIQIFFVTKKAFLGSKK